MINIAYFLDYCNSTNPTQTGSGYFKCPRQAGSLETLEWISAKLIGAWIKVILPKALKMTKVIVQQRSAENSQIKGIVIEFDVGPGVQVKSSLRATYQAIPWPARLL